MENGQLSWIANFIWGIAGEENNEEAGEHFTPRDVVKLMANLIFWPIADDIQSATYRVYDGACGTGGMLTVAEDTLCDLATSRGKDVSIHLIADVVTGNLAPPPGSEDMEETVDEFEPLDDAAGELDDEALAGEVAHAD